MLTADLVRYKVEGDAVTPRYISRKHADYYLGIAQKLIALFNENIGRERAEIDKTLLEIEGNRTGYKIIRGLVKLLLENADFRPAQKLEYPRRRLELFEFAAGYRPIHRVSDLVSPETREQIVRDFEKSHDPLPPSLYGDLPDHHILHGFRVPPSPEALLRRYNLALAQGLLYRSTQMRIRVYDSFGDIFRHLKLSRLMHNIVPKQEGYRILIDGPASLFHYTRHYGVNMAQFLPGLLLARKWQMEADIFTSEGKRRFSLDQDCGLVSHYSKNEAFDSVVEETFFEQFNKKKTDWEIRREGDFIDLGDAVLIPDFQFVHKNGQKAMLEIVGFWTPEYLSNKIEKLNRAGRQDLLIAVNEKLNCSREDFSGQVIFYKTRVKPKDVLAWLEELILRETKKAQ